MESLRDEKGVRKQVYKRGKNLPAITGEETEALMNVMKQQFTPETYRKSYKYEDIEDFRAKIVEYFDYITESNHAGAKLIPDIEGFCCYAGICRDTLNDWEHRRDPNFRETIRAFKNAVASYKKQLALKGKIPPIVFATDFNNNHGYTQKQEVSIHATNQLQPNLTREQIIEKVKADVVIDVDED
jgi:hypothetical protein